MWWCITRIICKPKVNKSRINLIEAKLGAILSEMQYIDKESNKLIYDTGHACSHSAIENAG